MRKTTDLSTRSPMDEINVKVIQEMTSVQLMYFEITRNAGERIFILKNSYTFFTSIKHIAFANVCIQ